MLKYSTLFRFAFFVISFGLFSSVNAAQTVCGHRIAFDDVLVVDLEPYADQKALLYEKVEERAGAFQLKSVEPSRIEWRGSRSNGIQRGKKFAADNGCNLLLIVGSEVEEKFATRYATQRIPIHFLIVEFGVMQSE